MEGYKLSIAAYESEVVCDTLFLNHVPNKKQWFTPMNKEGGDLTVTLKQVLLSNIPMIKIDKKNTLPKRRNKKQAGKFGALRMSNKDIDEILEEIHRRDKLDTEFDIEYDGEDTNSI